VTVFASFKEMLVSEKKNMHANEVETNPSLVRRLLATQFPQWANLPIEPVESTGTDNAIYRLGESMAVRMPRIQWAIAQIDTEERWLPVLAPQLPLALAVPIAKGLPGEGYPWSWAVVPWLEGQNAAVARIADLNQVAIDLAGFITALQRINTDGAPAPSMSVFSRGVPLAVLDTHVRDQIRRVDGQVDTAVLTAVWDAAVSAPVWEGPPVWIHGDLLPENLIVSHGRLSAVIDFGCLGVGDPACELIAGWYLFSGESRKRFREALGVDDATWTRARGLLVKAVEGLTYYADTSPAIVARCRHVLAQVAEDFLTSA
jgi:aminoglycoside phosphotransferase (APT) family kinase protein